MKKLDFVLSASLALAACHNQTAKTAPTPTPTQLGLKADSSETGHSVNVLPQNDHSEDATKNAKAIKDKVSALMAEQNALISELQKIEPKIAFICQNASKECVSGLRVLSKKNIPDDVMASCSGAFDPNDTCIDDEMIKRGLADKLAEVYEAGNACLHQVAIECPPKAKKAQEIMKDPAFKDEEKKQGAIQKDLNMRSYSGGQSQTDWKACELVADKTTGGGSDKRRQAFYDSPTTEAYGALMQLETAKLTEKVKCTDRMKKEAKKDAGIAGLLKQTRKNLHWTETEEFLTCTDSDPEFKSKSEALESVVAAYVENPTTAGRKAYLQAEINKFDRRRACEKELAGKDSKKK
ncbi:MAG: hypothetical protein WC843_00420 [Candidatus Gracilibacteria bacterium]|jgi:hypothetical protein